VFPVIAKMYRINTTEQMVDAEPQEIITNDNLNARVDAQVYFKVKADEDSVKSSQYNVNNYQLQVVNLARTTLRNIIGTLTLKSANSERDKINIELQKIIDEKTDPWGIKVSAVEVKELELPEGMKRAMARQAEAEREKERLAEQELTVVTSSLLAAEALAHSSTVTVLLLGGRMRGRTLATVDHWATDMLRGDVAVTYAWCRYVDDAIDLSDPFLQPVYDPASHLVYSHHGRAVSHSWIHGVPQLRDGELTRLDLEALMPAVRAWRDRIRQRHAR
jgi:hypothetical protein